MSLSFFIGSRDKQRPLEEDWPWVVEQLERDSALQVATLFAELCNATQASTARRRCAPYSATLPSSVRACKPEVNSHFSQKLAKIELPHEVQAPVLVAVGQKEPMLAKRAARQLSREIEGAKGVMVPGVGHAWNLEVPELFTKTVQARMIDAPLPQELIAL